MEICTACKRELHGGYYHTPYGLYCTACWEQRNGPPRRDISDRLQIRSYTDSLSA